MKIIGVNNITPEFIGKLDYKLFFNNQKEWQVKFLKSKFMENKYVRGWFYENYLKTLNKQELIEEYLRIIS